MNKASKLLPSLAALGTCLLAGCTTRLSADRVPAGHLGRGQAYYLPRLDFRVTVQRELLACDVLPEGGDTADARVHRWLSSELPAATDLARQLAGELLRGDPNVCDPGNPSTAIISQHCGDARLQVAPEVAFDTAASVLWDLITEDPVLQRGIWPAVAMPARRDLKQRLQSLRGAGSPGVTDLLDTLEYGFQQVVERMPELQPVFKARVSAQIASHLIADTGHAYAIDYEKLGSALKTTDITVEKYPNGTLKSINATIADQSAAVVQNVVTTVGRVVAAASGFPLPAAAAAAGAQAGPGARQPLPFLAWIATAPMQRISPCNNETVLLLNRRERLTSSIDDAAGEAAERDEQLGALALQELLWQQANTEKKLEQARYTATDPEHIRLKGEIEAIDARIKDAKAQGELLRAQAVLQEKELNKLRQFLDQVRARLTLTRASYFAPDHGQREMQLGGAEEAAEKWLRPELIAALGSPTSVAEVPAPAAAEDPAVPEAVAPPPAAEASPPPTVAAPEGLAEPTAPPAGEQLVVAPPAPVATIVGAAGDAADPAASSPAVEAAAAGVPAAPTPVMPPHVRPADLDVLRVHIALQVAQALPAHLPVTGPDLGVIYREPVEALLLVCIKSPCLDGAAPPADSVLAAEVVGVPQFGTLAMLPLVNEAFQRNVLTVSFTEKGSASSVRYESNARAAAASLAIADAAKQVSDFAQARRDADNARLQGRKDVLNAERDALKAELEVEQARAALAAFRNGEPVEEDDEEDSEGTDGAEEGAEDDGDEGDAEDDAAEGEVADGNGGETP